LNFWVPFFGHVGNDDLAAVVGDPSKVDLLMSTKGQKELTGKGDRAFWFTVYHVFVVIGVANLTRSALEH
jgi:HKD family nuclease